MTSQLQHARDLLAELEHTKHWAHSEDSREMVRHHNAQWVLDHMHAEVVAQARREQAGQVRLPGVFEK